MRRQMNKKTTVYKEMFGALAQWLEKMISPKEGASIAMGSGGGEL